MNMMNMTNTAKTANTAKTENVENYLRQLMSAYITDNLAGISPSDFQSYIQGLVGIDNHHVENYNNPSLQRDQSVRFTWGHNHDFGSFFQPGLMGDRHITILANFIDEFDLSTSLVGKRVLDIGCWTGGVSLLLAAMGANVTAVEEVVKYADAARYLADSFGVSIDVLPVSLYECDDLCDYDIVILSGVLYHITDPVVALRITFNCLRVGGMCYVESSGLAKSGSHVRYAGPTNAIHGGTKQDKTREGWDWFVPSLPALRQMSADVGYKSIRTKWLHGRLYMSAVKEVETDMLRAGLSRQVR